MFYRLKIVASTATFAVALVSAPAANARATLQSGLERSGTAVEDAALADMRGKFIAPGNISYFGIEMQSAWQRPDGVTTAATLVLNVDFAHATPGSPNVQLLVGWNRDGDSQMDVSEFGPAAAGTYVTVPMSAGGLGSVQGAVQSQQIAGSDNHVGNAMSIAIMPGSVPPTANTSGLTAVTSGENHQFSNGDTLQLVAGGNQAGIVIQSGGEQVRQMVDGSIGQAAQNVLVNSSGNDVRNSMAISIGTTQLDQAKQVSIQSNLEALKGWSF
jgi:hypothetical protein